MNLDQTLHFKYHLECLEHNLAEFNVKRHVHLRNYMFKDKSNKKNLNSDDNVPVNTRLHDGPVFNVTHHNSEPIGHVRSNSDLIAGKPLVTYTAGRSESDLSGK